MAIDALILLLANITLIRPAAATLIVVPDFLCVRYTGLHCWASCYHGHRFEEASVEISHKYFQGLWNGKCLLRKLCEWEGACLVFDDVVFFALGAHLLFRSSNQKPDSKAETEDNENLHPQSTCQEGGLRPSESPNKTERIGGKGFSDPGIIDNCNLHDGRRFFCCTEHFCSHAYVGIQSHNSGLAYIVGMGSEML